MAKRYQMGGFTDSACTFGIFWPLYFLFLIDLLILITIWYLLAIVLSVFRRFTDSDYPFGISDNTMAKRYQRGNQNQ
jgi:hypothetical protein